MTESPHAAERAGPGSSREWRNQLLTRFSWALFFGAGPLLVLTYFTVHVPALSNASFVVLLVTSACVGLTPRLDLKRRSLALLLALLFMGAAIVHNVGPAPGTFLSMALAVSLGTVVFGLRGGWLTLAVSSAAFLGFGLAGRHESSAFWVEQLPRPVVWFRLTGTYTFLAALIVALISSAMRRMGENEERLRLALEAARMGTWHWDIPSGAVMRDAQTAALLGLPDAHVPGTFEEFKGALLRDDRAAVEDAIARVLSGSETFELAFRVRTDPPRWLESKGRVYRDGSGAPILLRGTVTDIGERKRSEEALRESEGQMRALFASMQDVILVLDAEGRYLRIAPTSPGLLYQPAPELLGRTLHEVFPAERADTFLEQIRLCLGTRKTVNFEYELAVGGSPVWFVATVSPMTDDKVVWVARDDTKRRQGETALRESEERWRRISEATFEGIAFSQDGVLTDSNAQFAEMLGYEVPDLVGRPVAELVAPGDRSKVMQAIRSGFTSGYQHEALRKDGTPILVETRARSLTRHGRRIRVTAVRDISETHRLEAELRRRETLAAMGSLVAGVAHEVRTPLFSLSATLDALEAGVATPDHQQELKDLLRSQVRRLANLMQDLLDYGRPPTLRRTRAGIGETLQRAVRGSRATAAGTHGIDIALDVPDGLPEIDADVGRLEQVFANLLANALQHAPRGSIVKVTARRATGPTPGLTCLVEDDGPGLSPSDLPHVFEPFYSRRKGGTGMGLAIAQRFVEAHGGSLSAGNRPGAGAVFTVFLPEAAASSRAEARLPDTRLLIVDDETAIRLPMERFFAGRGFEVAVAATAAEALRGVPRGDSGRGPPRLLAARRRRPRAACAGSRSSTLPCPS